MRTLRREDRECQPPGRMQQAMDFSVGVGCGEWGEDDAASDLAPRFLTLGRNKRHVQPLSDSLDSPSPQNHIHMTSE